MYLSNDDETQPMQSPRDTADQAIVQALAFGQSYGVAPLARAAEKKASVSRTSQALSNAKPDPKDSLPTGPGFVYMSHLFKANQGIEKIINKNKVNQANVSIFTEQPEAVKTAISLMGIQTDRNPGGIPIDFNDARKTFFGDEDIDDSTLAQWKTKVEQGDMGIDPKRVRKFTNYDGSLTWEILNHDKTVASRFTIGHYKGNKIFAQGGYQDYVKTVGKAKEHFGPDMNDEFDWLRSLGAKP